MSVLPVGIGSGSGGGGGGYQISRSLRFNSADTAYLSRTFTTPTNAKKFTISAWVKLTSPLGSALDFGLLCGPNSAEVIGISGTGAFGAAVNGRLIIRFGDVNLVYYPQIFRDVSAWGHIVVAIDTDQAVQADRAKFYYNGVLQTATSSTITLGYSPALNTAAARYIGSLSTFAGYYANGYLAEYNFIDGQQLAASSFGQTNSSTGVWEPKSYSGTYGNNGFYLNFSNNSGTTSTTLGKDNSGNGNNWTPNNFSVTAGVGNDSLVDTPTSYGTDTGTGNEVRGNYATWNALDQSGATINNGNLYAYIISGQVRSTFGMTTGKWYWECTIGSGDSSPGFLTNMIGVTVLDVPITSAAWTTQYGFTYYAGNGFKYNNGSASSFGSTFTQNDIIGVALDADTGKIWFAKNGTWQASGNPAAGTNAAFTATSLIGRPFAALFTTGGYESTINTNFGQRAFSYTAPSGFKALCVQNLSTPTIGATSTTQANDYFDATLYTGNGANNRLVSNASSMNPDFVWLKARSINYTNIVFDSVRGTGKYLSTDQTGAENFAGTLGWTNSGPSTGGFVVDLGTNASINENATTFVGWQWKANGAGSSNTAGTITSTVSVNSTSKFSIATYTGNATTGATVGHGLGVAPEFIFWKRRNSTSNWISFNKISGHSASLYLDLTNANTTSNFLNNTLPSSTVVTLQANTDNNASGGTYVMYSFASVEGYSKIGSYTGDGSTDGPFVFCGFRPAYVLIKRTDTTSNWTILDFNRLGYNVDNNPLFSNLTNAEGTTDLLDLLSNGFKLRSTDASVNASSGTYLFAAFAENPFKYSLAR